jgi:membrane carboxypeptidase/penicillin-binding protein PbpC
LYMGKQQITHMLVRKALPIVAVSALLFVGIQLYRGYVARIQDTKAHALLHNGIDKFIDVDTTGLRVITTLDYDKQAAAEKIVKTQGDKFAKSANANNASLVAMDPKTGQILSLVGSRDFSNKEIDGQFNVAVLGRRQPGSSFKPFVYTAAFEKGYTPETVLYDVKTNFDQRGGASYSPKNYDGLEHGLVTMRKALQGSLNIPAVQTLYLVGSKNAIEFAKRFGYTTFTGDYGLSLVLGGAEVSLLEHTDAYATLANNGVYHPSVAILKVTDPKGNVLYEWKDTPGSAAITPEISATITNVLTDDPARAYIFGAHSTLTLPDRKVAAKTGTTNDSKDAWTMGYVPSLAVGVWVGNTIPSPMKGGGNSLAGTIWNQFMRAALASTTPERFPEAPPNTAEKAVLRGSDGGIKLPINTVTGRIATSSTPPELIVEKTFLPPHTILYYVNKDDPRGPSPTNPADDPQFNNWEQALQSWVLRLQAAGKPVTLEEPPTLTDDTISPELAPTVEILSPLNNTTLTSRSLTFEVKAGAPRGIRRVEYFVDAQSVGRNDAPPFALSYYAKTLTKGTHTLKVIASDDQGNATAVQNTFTLDAELDPASVDWFDASPLTLSESDFPRVMSLTPFRYEEVVNIKIVLSSNADKKQIYEFSPATDKLFNNQLSFTWKHSPGAGSYTLSATLTDKSGATSQKDLKINVQ